MAPPNRETVYSVLQYLDASDLKQTARTLERETGLFFNMKYFEELVIHGSYEEAEDYVEGFTTPHDNLCSTKIIFEIKKLKFLEALEEGKVATARRIARKEFRNFDRQNKNLVVQAIHVTNLVDFRTHKGLDGYKTVTARRVVVQQLKRLLESNPLFRGKLMYPISPEGAPMRFGLYNNNVVPNPAMDPFPYYFPWFIGI